MAATQIDIDVWRGSDAPPLVWMTPDGFSLGGSVVELSIYVGPDQVASLASGTDASLRIDDTARYIIWTPTLAHGRAIPLGRIARYELERRYLGQQEALAYGAINGLGGINRDD